MAKQPESQLITATSKPTLILYGPHAGRVLILREDAAAAAESDGWGVPYVEVPGAFEIPPPPDYSAGVPESYTTWTDSTSGAIEAPPEGGGTPAPDPDPVLTSIDPNTAAAGAADLTLTATGSGFVASSVIQFGGGALPTTYVSDTSLTATVSPAAAAGAETVPVTVATGAKVSAPVDFSFTAPAGRMGRRE